MIVKHGVITLKISEWESIKQDLIDTYGVSIMISWRSRRELGFTVRYHKELVKNRGEHENYVDSEWLKDGGNQYHYEDRICLDWWDESAKMMFILKYAEYLNT